ncbi:ABC transporter I family member 19 [Diplonema papillatum]|nr:ABC transporter I family member 19 [Diplonema papillatum]
MANAEPVIELKDLTYYYSLRGKKSERSALRNVNLAIPARARVLVVGQNGAGKSTLLKIIAGRTIVPEDTTFVLKRPAFHDTKLVDEITYLGEWWSQSRSFLDVTVGQIISEHTGTDRVKELCEVLRVDLKWKLTALSDGQLRRSQILFGLATLKPVIILDEITTDVDLLVRDSLLRFLRKEADVNGCTVLYATHIFEGLEDWAPTHILRVVAGEVKMVETKDIPELQGEHPSYFRLVRDWLRAERQLAEQPSNLPWQMRDNLIVA